LIGHRKQRESPIATRGIGVSYEGDRKRGDGRGWSAAESQERNKNDCHQGRNHNPTFVTNAHWALLQCEWTKPLYANAHGSCQSESLEAESFREFSPTPKTPPAMDATMNINMKPFLAILLIAIAPGCAHTRTPFVQGSIRIIPPVTEEGSDPSAGTRTLSIFNDGGTRWIKIRDATGQKFDIYIDHRIGTKTSGAIYLFDYPDKPGSVRVLNDREFREKVGVFE
jgi:hypothetical protein